MKLNMKRVALGLCMAACLFSLSACSKAETASAEVDANTQSQLVQITQSFFQVYATSSEEELKNFQKETEKQTAYEALAEGVDSWENVKHDLGALISVDDNVIVEEIDGGYNATVNAVFEQRVLEFSLTFDSGITKVTSVSFVPEYTLGENMEQAFMNMVMGMGTVFLVLIFISLIIYCFKFINQFETKMKNKGVKEEPAPAIAAAPVAVAAPAEEENLADDLELVAVITAAIAASTGTSPSGLVVRSIKRAPSGKWKKA